MLLTRLGFLLFTGSLVCQLQLYSSFNWNVSLKLSSVSFISKIYIYCMSSGSPLRPPLLRYCSSVTDLHHSSLHNISNHLEGMFIYMSPKDLFLWWSWPDRIATWIHAVSFSYRPTRLRFTLFRPTGLNKMSLHLNTSSFWLITFILISSSSFVNSWESLLRNVITNQITVSIQSSRCLHIIH